MNDNFVSDEYDWITVRKGSGKGMKLPYSSQLCVYIDKEGDILIPLATYERMERPDRIDILYDRGKNVIGLRAKGIHSPGYKAECTKDHARISPTKTTKRFKMNPKVGLHNYIVRMNDRTAIVDVKQTPVKTDWVISDEL